MRNRTVPDSVGRILSIDSYSPELAPLEHLGNIRRYRSRPVPPTDVLLIGAPPTHERGATLPREAITHAESDSWEVLPSTIPRAMSALAVLETAMSRAQDIANRDLTEAMPKNYGTCWMA